jgi:hypothetical protein
MKETQKVGRVGGFIILFFILTPVLVHAWSEDLLSHIQAYIDIQEEYNSNIDLTPNSIKRDDYITTVSPGLRISTSPKSPVTGQFRQAPITPKSPITGQFRQAPTGEENYGLDLDLRAGFNFFAKNHDENYTNLRGELNTWYAMTQKLNFRARDYMIRSNDVREQDFSADAIPGQFLVSRTGTRTPWFRNVFEPSVQYEFGRIDAFAVDSIALYYRNNVYKIQGRVGEDSMENFVNPVLNYWFDVRNGVSFQYGLDLGNFQQSPDLIGHMATGDYIYRFNPNTSIFGEYHQVWRNFDRPSIDYIIYRPSLGIQHAFSPTMRAKGQFGYFWQIPERGSTVSGFFYDVMLTQQFAERVTYTLSSQGGYNEDFYTSQNLGFSQYYRALGRIDYRLLERMSVGLFGSFEWDNHPRSTLGSSRDQKDKIWAVGGNASYQILRWLTFFLDLSHRENHSNISNGDYSEYRALLRATATY